MPIDFKASQVRTSKIIASGSDTRPYLLIYPSSSAANDSGGIVGLSGAGTDGWLYISGGDGDQDRVVFGGAVFVSGGLVVNRQAGGGGPVINGLYASGDFLHLNSVGEYLIFGDSSTKRVGVHSGTPSGTLHVGNGDGATPGLVVDDTAIVNYGRNGDNVATFMVRGELGKHEALFVVSASQERVGIRQYNPKCELDVSGSVMVTGSVYVSGTTFSPAFSGSLTRLTDGTSYLIAGSNVAISTGANGSVTISAGGGGGGSPGGSDTQVQFNDGGVTFGGDSGLTYNKITDTLTGVTINATTGFSGSLTRLTDGTSYLIAGSNVTISSASNGSVTISSTGGGGSPSAPNDSIQFNNAGSFGGSSSFRWIDGSAEFNVTGTIRHDGTAYYTGSAYYGSIGTESTIGINFDSFPSILILEPVQGVQVESKVEGGVGVSSIIISAGSLTSSLAEGSSHASIGTVGSIDLKIDTEQTLFVGSGSASSVLIASSGTPTVIGDQLSVYSKIDVTGSILPGADITYNLGSPSKRWGNIYTGDLHLRNERGNWTIVEESEYLCVINNLTGKRYKMMLQPLD